MKALVGAFNQEKALVGAFSVIVKTGCGTDGSFYSTKQEVHLGAVATLGLLGLAQQADTAADQRLNLATNWEYVLLNHTV